MGSVRIDDNEMNVMRRVFKVLEDSSDDEARRIIGYLWMRYNSPQPVSQLRSSDELRNVGHVQPPILKQ
jgi:hypothetical protein